MRTEDGNIIGECLNGKPEAFGVLVDKYKEGIYAFVYSEIRDFHHAQDVTQEVFMQAYRDLRSLRRWESFSFWLFRIARRCCGMWFRARAKRADQEFLEDQNPEIINAPSLDSYHNGQLDESLEDALGSLPRDYREVLVFHYFGGMTIKDIAQSIGVSPAAIAMRLSRARALLKEEMTTMMSITYNEQRLPTGFTFRIVEAVRRIRIDPMPRSASLSWGISVAMGIIITIMSLNPHLSILNDMAIPRGFPLPVESKVLKTGEIPVDIMKIDKITTISSNQGKGNSGEIQPPKPQDNINLAFMSPAKEGEWTRKADMPTGRVGLFAASVNGKIYAIGGLAPGVSPTKVEEFDPQTNKWLEKADMPTPRHFHTATVVKGKIYVIGGVDGGTCTNIIYEYDPENDLWTKKNPMPSGKAGHVAIAIDDKIYVFGGSGNDPMPSLSFYIYDPIIDQWQRLDDVPQLFHLEDHSVSYLDNKIYCFGGVNRVTSKMQKNIIVYDIQTKKWSTGSELPSQRKCMAGWLVGRNIYLIGGYSLFEGPVALSRIDIYNIDTDTWQKEIKPELPTKRLLFASSQIDNKIYVLGGTTAWPGALPDDYLTIVEEYNPKGSFSVNPQDKLPTTWGETKSH